MSCAKHGYTNNTYCPACDLETIEKEAMTRDQLIEQVIEACANKIQKKAELFSLDNTSLDMETGAREGSRKTMEYLEGLDDAAAIVRAIDRSQFDEPAAPQAWPECPNKTCRMNRLCNWPLDCDAPPSPAEPTPSSEKK